jgi:class 3 adenylate cyclase/multidrug efflux pump subunit AcrA (membrane-fusion protein)
VKRTIAVILAADVAGYSRLTAQDEEDTLRRLAEYSTVFRERVTTAHGRIFNVAGDAILAEFPSAVEALRAAIEIQKTLRERNQDYPPDRRVEFRIGITIGDVMEMNGDLLGDGVNIAARLQSLAHPGGICISRALREAVDSKVAAAYQDIGEQNLKNIPRPINVFRVAIGPEALAAPPRRARYAAPLFTGLGVVAVGAAVAAALYAFPYVKDWSSQQAEVSTGLGDRPAHLTASVARPQRKCYQDSVRLSGTITPRATVEVRPETEGLRVLRVLAEPPSDVTAGQVLAQLVPQEGPAGTPVPIQSPVSGTLGRSAAYVGEAASPRAPALFQIAAGGELELTADVPAPALRKISVGQTATVTPLGLQEIRGRVRLVSAEVDGATQLGRVRVLLASTGTSNLGIRWGTYASGTVSLGERCGISVPLLSLANSTDGTTIVYVANNGQIEARRVTTGLIAGNEVQIHNGLSEGDLVVLKAGPFLREGDLIRPSLVGNASS